jgi:hypothetical protein
MGLSLVFQKAKETETEVEYRWGHSLTEMDNIVVMEKSDPTGPEDDPRDLMAQRVIGLVMSRRTDQNPWPEAGAHES